MFFEKRLFNLALHAMQNTNQTVFVSVMIQAHIPTLVVFLTLGHNNTTQFTASSIRTPNFNHLPLH